MRVVNSPWTSRMRWARKTWAVGAPWHSVEAMQDLSPFDPQASHDPNSKSHLRPWPDHTQFPGAHWLTRTAVLRSAGPRLPIPSGPSDTFRHVAAAELLGFRRLMTNSITSRRGLYVAILFWQKFRPRPTTVWSGSDILYWGRLARPRVRVGAGTGCTWRAFSARKMRRKNTSN